MTHAASLGVAGRWHALRAPAALLITGGLLGLNLNTAKFAIGSGLAPASFLLLSILGAAILLFVLTGLLRQAPALSRPNLRYGFVSGLLSVAAPNTILFLALPHVGAGFVSLLGALPPLGTYALALLFRLEPPRWLRALGVAAGIAGAVLLGLSRAGAATADPGWVLVSLSVPVIVACGNIYRTMRWPPGATALQLAPLMLAGSVLWIGAYVAGFESAALPGTLALGLGTLILPLQVVIVALMYVMYFVLQRIAGPVYFSQIGSVGAIVGVAIAVAWFGETLPAGTALAAFFIALGVAGVTLGQFLARR